MRLSRLLPLLGLFAVLLAPLGMLGSHAAMAMPKQAASSGNCSEQQSEHSSGERATIDCAIACTALPSHEPLLPPAQIVAAAVPAANPILSLQGMRPEAATPPPRYS